MKNLITPLLAISFMILAVIGCKQTSSKNDPTNGIQVSAGTLIADYKANEVAADEQYKDRALAVTGIVDTIGKDIVDTMYVTLGTGKDLEFTSVQCMFADEHKGDLVNLKKGDLVRVVGVCKGKMGNVILRQCSIRR